MRPGAALRPPASRDDRAPASGPRALRARLRDALEAARARPTDTRAERALARQLLYQRRKAASRVLFPWQARAATLAADGAALPLRSGSIDVALSDNVIDHARDPGGIVGELVRVLRPGGVLYLTVHVHHVLWDAASRGHGVLRALGVPVEIGPFADHTVHLTEPAARALVARPELEILEIGVGRGGAPGGSLRRPGLRRLVTAIGRAFPKNRRFEVLARRTAVGR
jgi:SAM-dependent methyltransferase